MEKRKTKDREAQIKVCKQPAAFKGVIELDELLCPKNTFTGQDLKNIFFLNNHLNQIGLCPVTVH